MCATISGAFARRLSLECHPHWVAWTSDDAKRCVRSVPSVWPTAQALASPFAPTEGGADRVRVLGDGNFSVAIAMPSWSSEGPTLDGIAKPEVVAPGRKIVSVRVPGSTI